MQDVDSVFLGSFLSLCDGVQHLADNTGISGIWNSWQLLLFWEADGHEVRAFPCRFAQTWQRKLQGQLRCFSEKSAY